VPHAPAEATAACSRCHAAVVVVHGGKGNCASCHTPHGELAEGRVAVACSHCHGAVAASDTSAHAGGVACESCHKAHDFAPPERRTLCATCHASESALATPSKGHADCTACHGPSTHAPAKAPACGTCHKQELASAPTGHQACISCHEPHAGSVRPQAACATCHMKEAATAHAGVQGGCETCHRPHGPGGVAPAPGCTTCHARDRLPALHAIPAHAACATCHASHVPPRSDRATCTGSCHANRRDHQPEAQVCTGCHVFRH
jgi:hypothetical protein